MFEALDTIPWHEVQGSYGAVPTMPDAVRALTSGDPAVATKALHWIGDQTYHQGSRWPATALVVPFLFEAAERPTTLARDDIIGLLLALAIDETVPLLPDGFRPGDVFAAVKDVHLDPRDERAIWRTEDWDTLDDRLHGVADLMPARYHYDAYLAVGRGADALIRLTADPDPVVRRGATWALGWFPDAAGRSIHAVREAVRRESDPYLLANALMVLGVTGRYLGVRDDVPGVSACLGPDRPLVVRRAAALALGTLLGPGLPAVALDLLIDATEDDDGLRKDAVGLGWTSRNCSLKGYFWRVLHSLGL